MVTEPGTHELEITRMVRCFPERIISVGQIGVLEQKAGTTPDGFPVDETGKVHGA